MQTHPDSVSRQVREAARFLFWALAFAAGYSQSPLYTSNQNQYFLHGLARAGYGSLERDWLANTLDPTPVFSGLVELAYRLLRWEAAFYLIYALLLGVYLYSLVGIVKETFWKTAPGPASDENGAGLSGALTRPGRALPFVALVFIVHSAGLRFALSRTLGVNWTYVLEDGVADQRLLGPVLQPSAFGVFLLLSILLFLRGRPTLAVLAAGLAATVHPTYLLSAGVLTLAYLFVTYREMGSFGKTAALGLVALAAVAPILIYAYRSFGGAAPEAARQARELLVHFRIPHHAVVAEWLDATVAAKLLLVAAALVLARRTRLFPILLLPSLAALGLTIVQVALDSNVLALIFPWRMSVFIVPLSTGVILGWAAGWAERSLFGRGGTTNEQLAATVTTREGHVVTASAVPVQADTPQGETTEVVTTREVPAGTTSAVRSSPGATPGETTKVVTTNSAAPPAVAASAVRLRAASLALISLAMAVGLLRFGLDLGRKASAPERAVEGYIAANHGEGEVYLTPVKLQDFRLAAGAPVFVDFKSIPYHEADFLEWHRRIQAAEAFYQAPSCEALAGLARREQLTHAVLEQAPGLPDCPGLEIVYQDEAYLVYDLGQPAAAR